MEEVRKALEDGKRVDLVFVPFPTHGTEIRTLDSGHRQVATVKELEAETHEHGTPWLAFWCDEDENGNPYVKHAYLK